MSEKQVVKHRSSVSSSQVAVLELLCQFRFASVDLLSLSLNLKTVPGLRRKLKILVDQGYAGRRYDSSYRIKGMPVAYYITAKGLKALQALPGHEHIDERFIKSCYRDKSTTVPFIEQYLAIYQSAHDLKRLYPEIKFFTRRGLIPFTHFPENPPDAFLGLRQAGDSDARRFFLDYIPDDMPRYPLDSKIAKYVQYFEEDGWAPSKSPLPTMLLLCESVATERRVLRQTARKLQALNSDEPEYYTSTIRALKNATGDEKDIWTSVADPDNISDLAAL